MKGSLKKQLGIPIGRKIPKSLVDRIVVNPVGKIIKNPALTGKSKILITEKLKKRAYFMKSIM